jgi:translation initiation factor IF-2
MNNVSQPKVFEFAKEIGMETLALMDKIREWKLPVRSHMAELDEDLLEQIRTRLRGGDEPAAAPAKKKVAKPKATSTAGAAKATKKPAPPPLAANAGGGAAAAAAAAKKAAAKKAGTSGAGTDSLNGSGAKKAGAASKAGAAAVVKKAPAKVVVRRKSDEEEAQALAAAEAASHAAALAEEQREADEAEAAATKTRAEILAAQTAAAHSRALEERAEERAQEKAQDKIKDAKLAAEAAARVSETEAEEELQAQAPVAEKMEAAESIENQIEESPEPEARAEASATAVQVAPPQAQAPARKREVVMTSQGPVSGVRSDAPRRNIVGRMDLSRVQAPGSGPTTGSAPAGGGGGPTRAGMPTAGPRTSGPGFGPARTPGVGMGPRPGGPGGSAVAGPRPLRTGFVAQGPVEVEDEATIEARRKFDERKNRVKPVTGGPGAGTGREKEVEVANFSSTEFRKREMVFQPKKKKSFLNREAKRTEITKSKASKRVVKVDQTMKLSDLANEMGLKAGQVTKVLMQQGVMATMNTELDFDTIALIAPEFGYEAVNVHRTVDQLLGVAAFGKTENISAIVRAPVVTIMGHVDHGKTSLLDAIRKANVASGEAGGITQHIGAYQVTTEDGLLITFIDTPGHEAFTAMRARGANVTDIAVIVVAADDGVMPQTIEAVNHAKAAGVPIIVALNKMDKVGANPDRVKQQLTEQQLVPEEWGGDTIYVPVSAHTKEGLPQLLEQIYLVAEVEELTANPEHSATGIVIESRMDKGRGPVATLLVQDGTLKVGQTLVVGTVSGRVRNLINDKGERIASAGPSVPVEILGLSEVPQAGDRFDVTVDDKSAAEIAQARRTKADEGQGVKAKVSLEDIFAKFKQGDLKELAIILKTDVGGSIEAIRGMFEKVATAEVKIKLVHAAVGGINESDVLLASTAKGVVVGFNVRPDGGAQTLAKRHGVEIKTYSIVYEMMDDLKKAMAGLLTPEIVEKQLGRAEVRETFTVPKIGMIAGSFISEGKITRNAEVRLVRDGKIVYTGKLASLRRFKDDAKEVAQGYECGIGIENFNDLKVGDIIEAFVKESIVRAL